MYDEPPTQSKTVRQPQQMGAFNLAAFLLAPLVLRVATTHDNLFTLYQVQTQDLPILIALPLLLLILQRRAPAWQLPDWLPGGRVLLTAGVAFTLLLGWATHALFFDYAVSRDEHMVLFDMAVYDKGRFAAPLTPHWRAFALSLVPAFLLNDVQPVGLVSAYLPGNALLRLAFAHVGDPAFFNPALALAGGVALYDIGKRLFGEDHRALGVTLLIYALSSQLLVNAMTTYAMTGHTALNLVWLAAFLRGGRLGHAAAIAVGLIATGLHQIVFHPLFAAPFVLWRWHHGAWRIAALYAAAYCAIIGWWIVFPTMTALYTGIPSAAMGPNNSSLIDRVLPLLLHHDPLTVSWMMLNLLRFVAWQHLALLPLLVAAVPVAWRGRGPGQGIAAPMLAGIALATLFLGFVLPFQGHGWGYRYYSPFLGSFALLAGIGYRQLAKRLPRHTDGAVIALSLATVAGAIPLLLIQANAFTRPHVALDRLIAAKHGDFVVIDTDESTPTTDGRWAVNAVDEVRNDPDLINRPLRFSSRSLNAGLVTELCRRGRVSVVGWPEMHRAGLGTNVIGSGRRFVQLTEMLRRGGCLVT